MNDSYNSDHFLNAKIVFKEIKKNFKQLFKKFGLILSEDQYMPTREEVALLKEIAEFCQWTSAAVEAVERELKSKVEKLKH